MHGREAPSSLSPLRLTGLHCSQSAGLDPQACVRSGWLDFVGLGRMVLSYPGLPNDVLESGRMERKLICRTFSDSTAAPRNGLVSGCFPLDPHYKGLSAAAELKRVKGK